MANKIRLHIGTHKTGTTALQEKVQSVAPALRTRGWHYLSGGPNHSWLYLLFVDDPHSEHDMVKRGLGSPAIARQWVEERRAALADELAATGYNIFISGEELCRLPAEGVFALLDFLSEHTNDIGVVCSVRAPLAYCISEAQEGIKGGLTLADVIADPPVARYRSALAAYVERLSPSRVRVLRYAGWEGGAGRSITTQVLEAADVSIDGLDLIDQPRVNGALSREAARLLSHLNATIPMYVAGELNPVRASIPSGWLRRLGTTRFSLPRASLARSLAMAQDELRWLRALVGEDWFSEDDAAAVEALADDDAGDPWTVSDPLSQNVAAVLHDAAALVRDCMTTMLSERARHAAAAGDAAQAARHRTSLYHIRPELEHAGRLAAADS